MKSSSKLAKTIGPIVVGVLLVGISRLSLNVSAALSAQATLDQPASVSTLTPETFVPRGTHQWSPGLPFSDEFEGTELDRTKWEVMKGNPTVENGKLMLPGGTTKAEIQSKVQFQSGVLQAVIESSDWKPQHQAPDSSFGFELWTGANGQCHYGVIFIASGHLGVLRSQPDASNNCSGDPAQQVYVPISNWDAVRAAGTVYLTLTWSPDGVMLHVSDGGSHRGQAAYTGEANPTVPLEIRLNVDTGEIYAIDYVRTYALEERTLLVDDFEPQPQPGQPFWPHNRLGGDRGPINVEGGTVVWGQGAVTATITAATPTGVGVWTALNHPIADHKTINFAAIFPSQIKPEFQGQITDLQIEIVTGTGTFQVELKAQNPLSPADEIVKWQETVLLTGAPLTLHFSLPLTLGEIQNLNWLVTGNKGDFVVVDRVVLTATLPHLDTSKRAFLWSYAMLLNNWDPDSGLTRDHAYWEANKFDNISASGMQAAAAVMAWQQGFISQAAATEIVTQTTQALLGLPRDPCGGKLWPHFVEDGQIISGTEWSSIDTVIASLALLEARQALGLNTTAVEEILTDIDWQALLLSDGHISHGYWSDCQPIDANGQGGWQDFGTESWLVNFGYAAATNMVADFDHTPPTVNGSGFIDELAWLLMPAPCRDRWGTKWCDYSQQAADSQIAYYLNHPCHAGPPRLFGLSAAEVPDLATIPMSESTYRAFGIGGETPGGDSVPPNDGRTDAWVGHAVIVPHYAALIASLRPTQTLALWEWIEMEGLFSPLNNVESFMVIDSPTCEQVVWNALKSSWHLSLQTLGWGRLLAGEDNLLYQGVEANEILKQGYQVMTQCSQGPINAPTSKAHNLDEEAKDWGVFCEESPTGDLPTWDLIDVPTPSLDGTSLQCSITGGDPYSNVHCYRNLLPEPNASVFVLTMPFYFTPTTTCDNQGDPSTVQALEFSLSKWHQDQRYEFALQWQNVGAGAPQWRYWDSAQWVPISPTLTHCLEAEQWYTLTLEGEIIAGQVHYHRFAITDTSHILDLTVPPVSTPGEADRLAIAVQLDGNFQADPYQVFVDQVNFVRKPALSLTKHVSPTSPVQDGAPLTYTIHITNNTSVTFSTTITDFLPDHVTPHFTSTHMLVWSVVITAPGGVWTQQIPVTVTTGYTGPLTNKVNVTPANETTSTASVTVCVNYCITYLPLVLKETALSINRTE